MSLPHRFAVSFVPLEAIDHVINISFNKEPVQGSPFVAKVRKLRLDEAFRQKSLLSDGVTTICLFI